jgi:hypothetical protein
VVDTVAEHDGWSARDVNLVLKSGEIDFSEEHRLYSRKLFGVRQRGVSWVIVAKKTLEFAVVRNMPLSENAKILQDQSFIFNSLNKAVPEMPCREMLGSKKMIDSCLWSH